MSIETETSKTSGLKEKQSETMGLSAPKVMATACYIIEKFDGRKVI